MLVQIQHELLEVAAKKRDEAIVEVRDFKDVMPVLNQRKLVLAPWCETEETEDEIKKLTKEASGKEEELVTGEEGGVPALTGAMKSLCIPLEQRPLENGTKCFFTNAPAKRWAL